MAVKSTSQLIPFCHPLPISKCDIHINYEDADQSLIVDCVVSTEHKTGVEMEALTAVSVAALTLYDMCKAMSHDIRIDEIKLEYKHGGKNVYNANET